MNVYVRQSTQAPTEARLKSDKIAQYTTRKSRYLRGVVTHGEEEDDEDQDEGK